MKNFTLQTNNLANENYKLEHTASGSIATNGIATVEPVMTEKAVRTKWFSGLDSIRFVLAFIVVLSHCPNPSVKILHNSSTSIIRYFGMFLGVSFVGVAAVVAFFIISGFVIHYPNKNGIKDIKKFYTRRLVRVLVPLLIIKFIGYFFNSPEDAVMWSLYCELIYYITYPFLAAIKLSWKNKLLLAYGISIIVICTLGRHDISSMLSHSNQGYNGELWQLGAGLTWIIGLPFWLLGVNLAQRIDQSTQAVSIQKQFLFRAVIIALSIAAGILRFHAFVSYLVTLTILALPMAKWLEMEILYYRKVKPVTFLENSGKFSYSLYLCHPIIIAILGRIITLTPYTYFLYLAVCLVGAYLFYLVLEKPSHLLAERLTRPAKRIA